MTFVNPLPYTFTNKHVAEDMLRQRAPKSEKDSVTTAPGATQPTASSNTGALSKSGHAAMDAADDPRQPLLGARDDAALSQRHLSSPPSQDHPSDEERPEDDDQAKEMENLSRKSQWIVLALASGACAAFNGVFAKLYVISLLFSVVRGSDHPKSAEGEDILLLS